MTVIILTMSLLQEVRVKNTAKSYSALFNLPACYGQVEQKVNRILFGSMGYKLVNWTFYSELND